MYPTTPIYTLKDIRPQTDIERTCELIGEINRRLGALRFAEWGVAHMMTVRNLRDDLSALNAFLMDELTAMDDAEVQQEQRELKYQ